jgi:hypothetical protein
MQRDELDELIKQLRDVRLQQEQLRTQEDQILQRIITETSRGQQTSRTEVTDEDERKFSTGDQIVITNKISIPTGRTANIDDRRGVVLYTKEPWIYIRTNNGFETKRYAKNLKKLK